MKRQCLYAGVILCLLLCGAAGCQQHSAHQGTNQPSAVTTAPAPSASPTTTATVFTEDGDNIVQDIFGEEDNDMSTTTVTVASKSTVTHPTSTVGVTSGSAATSSTTTGVSITTSTTEDEYTARY